MSRKSKTPPFIHELPLLVNTREEQALLVRMDMPQLNNTCLDESLVG